MSRDVRLQARDPRISCLVQAPAGSGKTELLIQRMLGLLAIVDEPEEILALTFTRKAAAEMRRRLMDALNMPRPEASEDAHADGSHKLETWRLAQQARRRSQEKGWRLSEHPSRLRIMTLDSFAYMLARQSPLLSGMGEELTPMEDAEIAYREAAESALAQASHEHPQAAERILLHQDHNVAAVVELLAGMLARREQWLGAIARHRRDMCGLRRTLEANLEEVIAQSLRRCDMLFPEPCKKELPSLIAFAGEQAGNDAWREFACWPNAASAALPQWKAIADFLLLADKPSLRKRVNKNHGFPAGREHHERKARMQDILESLAAIPGLADALHRIRRLPPSAGLDEDQWRVLEALFDLLILANMHLQQRFASTGEADFTEIALRAMAALGAYQDTPGEMLLKLDDRINHILVDEFQDTSQLQMDLLQCLTAGWQDGDGKHRTLFLVGDPMQSIYRFRKAEVGLFLNAAANQTDLPKVRPLQLERNFRSAPAIVNWVNEAFRCIFPERQDAVYGAVAHASAQAALKHEGEVVLHLQRKQDDHLEAQTVVELVTEALKRTNADGEPARIGILARSRTHLHAIIPALSEAGIPFRAVEILPLQARPEIRCLRALIGALSHPADRASWAAILRAPCCGLDSLDLYRLIGDEDAREQGIWALMADDARLERLSEDGRRRVMHVRRALEPCVELAGSIAFRDLLEYAWERLAMPALIDATAARNVDTALELVSMLERGGRIDPGLLDERLQKLYAAPDASEEAASVELLTMHGAKGLQWDTVILPGLGKTNAQRDAPLLAFSDVPVGGKARLLMAAKAPTRDSDPLYDLVRDIEKQKDDYELQRLLYVACTRARTSLHLLGHVSEKNEKPAPASLLHLLLREDPACFGAEIIWRDAAGAASETRRNPLRRIRDVPVWPDSAEEKPGSKQRREEIEYVWAGPEAAPIGTAVHAALQHIGECGVENIDTAAMPRIERLMRRVLMLEGLSAELLEDALRRALAAVRNTLNSESGRWILSSAHQDAHCEWRLSARVPGGWAHRIIDRSFIDAKGHRWVIDYKTSAHEGGDLEAFLANEAARHKAQMQEYLRILQTLEPGRRVRAGLYFPLLDAWYEYAASELIPPAEAEMRGLSLTAGVES